VIERSVPFQSGEREVFLGVAHPPTDDDLAVGLDDDGRRFLIVVRAKIQDDEPLVSESRIEGAVPFVAGDLPVGSASLVETDGECPPVGLDRHVEREPTDGSRVGGRAAVV
jgi:hypothetical protein